MKYLLLSVVWFLSFIWHYEVNKHTFSDSLGLSFVTATLAFLIFVMYKENT